MAENKKGTPETIEETTVSKALEETEDTETPAEKIVDTGDSDSSAEEPEVNSEDTDEEQDDALESFLSREQESKKPAPKKVKPLLIIIIAAVIVAGLVLALILINGSRKYEDEDHDPADITLSVGENGEHEASVGVDENGNILQNGEGSLLTYVPADITEIDVENTDGSFTVKSSTPEGEATVYTIVGLEDYDLQSGIADEIANNCAELNFLEVASASGDLKDFGLDEPRATVTVKYKDDTYAVIRVGNDAAGEAGVYIAFGSSDAVYLVSSDVAKPFLYSVNEFIDLAITDTNEDSETADFSTLTISGTHYDEPITLEPPFHGMRRSKLPAHRIPSSPHRPWQWQ